MARLGDVCDILNGFAFKSEQYVDDGIRIIRIANVQKGYIEDSTPVFYPLDSKDAKRYSLEEGDILMSLTGNVGRVAKLSKEYLPAALNQRVACLRIKNGVTLDKAFLFDLLNSDYFEQQCIAASKGVAQKNMSTEWLKEYKIPMFPLEQQQAIASVLDKVSELIALRKEQLAKLDRLVESRFIELFGTIRNNKFGYVIKTLQDVCEQIKDGTHQTPIYTEDNVNGYKFLSSKDVTTGRIDWTHLKYIPEKLHNELYARIAPKKGDVLLAKNGTTGIAAIVDRDEVFDIYVSLALLRPIDINSVYLWAAINSVETKQQFDSSLKGIGVPNLHLGEIKKAKIIVPPMDGQKAFATFVEQTDKSKLAIQQSLDKLELLKKSLMQEYFG